MAVFRLAGIDAKRNYEKQFPLSRWHDSNAPKAETLASNRLRHEVFQPHVETDLSFNGSAFFTIGSCFAREVEKALLKYGQKVLSWPESASIVAFHGGGYTNRYNCFSMLNELEFALDNRQFNPESVAFVDRSEQLCLDLHSHPAGGFVGYTETLNRRAALINHFSHIRDADVVTITLGLAEAWYDNATGEYLNVSPSKLDLENRYKGRFEFHVTDFGANLKALERIYGLLMKANPSIKIVITVSPVPLLATFSGRDIVTANTYSKAVLRACAETWVSLHAESIVYFPSFEMTINSDPTIAWMPDRIHVAPSFVKKIMENFLTTFKCDRPIETNTRRSKIKILELDTRLSNLMHENKIEDVHSLIQTADRKTQDHPFIVTHLAAAFLAENRIQEAWELLSEKNVWTYNALSAGQWRLMRVIVELGVRSRDRQKLEAIVDRTLVHITGKPGLVRKLFQSLWENHAPIRELCNRYISVVEESKELKDFLQKLREKGEKRPSDT